MFQEIIVFFVVVAAVTYLARTLLQTFNGKGAKKCGGCAGACGGKVEQKQPQQLVQLQINLKDKLPR